MVVAARGARRAGWPDARSLVLQAVMMADAIDERVKAGRLHAVELATSGYYQNVDQVEWTMHRDEGEPEARIWLADPDFRDAVDDLCRSHWTGAPY